MATGGFHRVRQGRLWALAPGEAAGTLLDALRSGLLDVSSGAALPLAGRGAVVRVALPGGGAAIVRRARRGGIAGRLLPDFFAGAGRARCELEVTARARKAGLPVPEPLGILSRRHVCVLAVWVATREIAGAEPVSRLLAGRPRGPETRTALFGLVPRIARMIRDCHDRGLVHADLNMGNVLSVAGEAAGLHLVDLDRAHWRDGGANEAERFGNLSRLARSAEKLLGEEGCDLIVPLIESYAAAEDPVRGALLARAGAHEASMKRHRAGWRISGRN